MEYGRRRVTRKTKAALAALHMSPTELLPITVACTPCSCSIFNPEPDTRGSGSTIPATTRFTPCLRDMSTRLAKLERFKSYRVVDSTSGELVCKVEYGRNGYRAPEIHKQ